MPGTSNSFTLNGMNDNSDVVNLNFSGASGLLLGQNQIQEATVVSNGYSGHFGGAAGSNVNYVTKAKSGANDFHTEVPRNYTRRHQHSPGFCHLVDQRPVAEPNVMRDAIRYRRRK